MWLNMSNYRFDTMTVFRKDNDGHKFVVPANLADRFDELFNHYCEQKYGTEAYWDAEAAFNNEFEEYMVG